MVQVLTSYAVLESCFRKEHSGFKRKGKIVKEKSPMHAIEWHRVIVSSRPSHAVSSIAHSHSSLMRPTTSKSVRQTLRKPPSSFRRGIAGASQERLFRTAWASSTALCGSLAVIRFHTTFVRLSYTTHYGLPLIFATGKLCDCKSLHWKFKDKRSCDGTSYRLSDGGPISHKTVQTAATAR